MSICIARNYAKPGTVTIDFDAAVLPGSKANELVELIRQEMQIGTTFISQNKIELAVIDCRRTMVPPKFYDKKIAAICVVTDSFIKKLGTMQAVEYDKVRNVYIVKPSLGLVLQTEDLRTLRINISKRRKVKSVELDHGRLIVRPVKAGNKEDTMLVKGLLDLLEHTTYMKDRRKSSVRV